MTSRPDTAHEPVSALAPLRVTRYRRIWLAATVSHLGTFLQMTAGPWLMHELTGSPLMVGLVTTALLMPRLVLTLPAGVLADAMDRRTLILVGHIFSALPVMGLAALTYLEMLTPSRLLVLTTLVGVGNAIGLPSFQTLVPDLVPRPLLAQAVTLNSASFNVARALGPSLGGALVAVGLTHAAFGANAVSYLAVVGVLLTFPREEVAGGAERHLWRSTALGLRYVRFTRPIRVLLVVTALFAVTAASVQAMLPSLSSDRLQLGAAGFGVLYGLFGTGALVGAATRDRVRVRAGAHMLPATIALFGVAGVVVGLVPNAFIAGGALFVNGAAWVWTMTTLNASVQTLAPRWVRGRVVSLFLLAIGMQPLGAFLAGALAEVIGVALAVAALTFGTAVVGIVSLRLRLPVLGHLDEPQPPPDDFSVPQHAVTVGGSPIVVVTTWEIDPERFADFIEAMRQLRRQRLRTGATRWSLFRDVDRPHVVTEMFSVPDWQEHLAQHARIDAQAAGVIRHARSFDVRGEPVSRHLAGLDSDARDMPALHEQLLTVHAELHRTDGSVPIEMPDDVDQPSQRP